MIFDKGEKQNLEQLLNHKEQRVLYQKKLFQQFPEGTLVSCTLNIPGPIKNNTDILELFQEGMRQVRQIVQKYDILYQKEIHLPSGNDGFIMLQAPVLLLKKRMVELEETSIIGRLLDIDVLFYQKDVIHVMSRKDLSLESRKCLLCSNEAKICGRSRRHSINELQHKIDQIYRKMRN